MSDRSTFAHFLHDAGLAVWFGGSLMGAVGVNGAAAQLDDPGQRARAASAGWARWTPVNAAAIGATLPYPVVDGYLGLLTVDPPQTGGFQPIVLPEISDGPHFWYAVQWFMFAGIGLAGIVVFIRGDLRERRAERQQAERAAAGEGPNEAGAAPTPELSVPGS